MEQLEGVVVEHVGHEVADGGGVLARIGPVRARAARPELARAGQQVDAGRGDVVDAPRVELAVEQGGGVGGPRRDGVEHGVPLVVGELPDPDDARGTERARLPGPGALHSPGSTVELADAVLPRA